MNSNQKSTFSYKQKIEKKHISSSPVKKPANEKIRNPNVQVPQQRQIKSEPAPSNIKPNVSVSIQEGGMKILEKELKSASISLPENNQSPILSGMVPVLEKIPSLSMEESWKRKDKVIIKLHEVLKRNKSTIDVLERASLKLDNKIQELKAVENKLKNFAVVPELKDY